MSPKAPTRHLIGRQAELAAVDELLAALPASDGSALFVTGEPGIGKTALLRQVLDRAAERGYQPFSGRAAEFELDRPFAMVVDALDQMRQAAAQPGERHEILESMRSLLESLGRRDPLVLALDDMHWADEASIDLVCRCLHRGFDSQVLLVLASRPAQAPARLLTAFEEAERHGIGRRLELSPLSEAEARELLEGVEADLQETLYGESGGNPFYLEQLAGARGRVAQAEESGADLAQPGVPTAVTATIQHEVEALPGAAMALLQGGAVLGEPFDPELAAETASLDAAATAGAMDELLASGIVLSTDVPRSFTFRHPIVRRAVYDMIGGGRRLEFHGHAADSLARRGAPAAVTAHHVERSASLGDEAAIALLTDAGQQAAQTAPASAARWFEAALRLIPESSENLNRRLELIGQRAAALGVAGHVEESREALGEFLRLSPRETTPGHLQMTVLAAILDELLGNQARGRELLEAELGLSPDPSGPQAAELCRELAFSCFFDADWAGMAGWARKSLAADGDGMVRVGALSALALAEYGLGNLPKVRDSVDEARGLFDGLADDEVAGHHPGIAIWLAWAEVCTEAFDEAIRHLDRCVAISNATGQRHLTPALLAVKAQALTLSGRIDELVSVAEGALEAALMSDSDLFLSWAMTARCQADLQTGDILAAVRSGERGVGVGAGASSPLGGLARVQLASALLEAGEPERSRDQLVTAEGEPDPPPFPLYEPQCYELLVRVELMLGQAERAERFAQRAEDAAERLPLNLPIAHASRARALISLEQGQLKEAGEQARASASAAEQGGALVEAARSRTLAGRVLAEAGDRDGALVLLEEAHEQLVRCGASRYRDEAARELRKLGRAVSRPAGPAGDGPVLGGLSKREREVIELVAAGRTNREIAGELFLSVRTVDRHVSRIFEKLDVNSRTAATSVFERARTRTVAAADRNALG